MERELIDRFRGCLYGQAIGDALGLGTEFMTDEDIAWKYPHGLQHYKQIYQDRHRKRWEIGDWTDDTDMMLCIADAVIEDKGVNFLNIARHFKTWAEGSRYKCNIANHDFTNNDICRTSCRNLFANLF